MLKLLEIKWDLAVPGPLPVTWGPSRHSLRLALRSQSSKFQEGISDSQPASSTALSGGNAGA